MACLNGAAILTTWQPNSESAWAHAHHLQQIGHDGIAWGHTARLSTRTGGHAASHPMHVGHIDCKLRTHDILGRDEDVEVAVGGDLVGAHIAKANKGARIAPVHALHNPADARQGQRHALRAMVPVASASGSSPAAAELTGVGCDVTPAHHLARSHQAQPPGSCWWGLLRPSAGSTDPHHSFSCSLPTFFVQRVVGSCPNSRAWKTPAPSACCTLTLTRWPSDARLVASSRASCAACQPGYTLAHQPGRGLA